MEVESDRVFLLLLWDLRHFAWCYGCDGTEQAFAPALLRLRPGCIALPADSLLL